MCPKVGSLLLVALVSENDFTTILVWNDIPYSVGGRLFQRIMHLISSNQNRVPHYRSFIQQIGNISHYIYQGHNKTLGKEKQRAEVIRRMALISTTLGKLTKNVKDPYKTIT